MKYSVVIRTKNSQETVRQCLESLADQTLTAEEIIVVDSGSSDSTFDILSHFKVRVIHYPNDVAFNYSKALNIGIRETTTDLVLMMSSHVSFLHKDSVALMMEKLRDEGCKAVSFQLAWHSISYNDSVEVEFSNVNSSNFRGQAMFNSCSMIRKQSWQAYPFNEELPNCEDQDFAYHFIKLGDYTTFINHPKVCYRNPYYNSIKEAVNKVTIGRLMYPRWISMAFMFEALKKGIRNLIGGKKHQAKKELIIFWYIFKYRFFGLYSRQSIYNEKLK